jgi:hypothetical protein
MESCGLPDRKTNFLVPTKIMAFVKKKKHLQVFSTFLSNLAKKNSQKFAQIGDFYQTVESRKTFAE